MADSGGDDLDYMLPANCPNPYFDTWDRHNSIAFSATKGLRNAPGENNCFVNCAVQVFWHLDVFRRSYRRLLGHTCMGNSCIFCALKVIFTQFQYSDKSSLHPVALRKALAETFANQQRFQLGHMDDAAECFENILRRIHFHIACNHNEDACTAPHCLPHQKFSMAVYEKVVCPCGASTSPLKFSEMVHYVSASALISQSRMMQENGDALHPDRFGLLLRKASAIGDVRDCPANCGKQVQKQRTLLNIPDVVSVGLVWDSDHPSVETTTEVARALGTAVLLQDMYHRVMPDIRKLPRLQLVAVVCYYGKHYSTFVFHSKLQTWVYFDDAAVREVGPQWENVVDRCSRGRFQPLLLLYANPSAAPVSVDTAPRKRVMAPGYAPAGAGEETEGSLDRTQDSMKGLGSPGTRSTTPTPKFSQQGSLPASQSPEATPQNTGRDSPARLSREHSRQPSFLFAVTGKNDKNKLDGGEGGSHGSGVLHPPSRRQLLDGGAHLETMAEDVASYTDYTLSSGDQYRRPSLNGAESKTQFLMLPSVSHYPDAQRKDSFTKRTSGKEKGGVEVVRYQVDPNRPGSRTPDFSLHPSHSEGLASPKGEKVGHKAPVLHGRQRSLSSGREEEGGDVNSGSQHVVVKPKPTGHGNCEPAEGFSHTPVQSGLATLPRQKGQNHGSDTVSHQRSGPVHQEVAQLTRKGLHQCTAVDPPLPPGTPPPEYNAAQDCQVSHSRQTSVTSQAESMKSSISMGHIDQVTSSKKSEGEKVKKKVKKEKKSEKDSSKKSEKKKSKSDPSLKKSESKEDLLGEKNRQYIDRRMVENILKHQGVHRQNSSCSNNSASSVESDSLMGKLLANKASSGNLTVDIPFDNMSLGSQKDSGYGSSDRNSSSSTGSGTVDPYTQYFISKSMVVPRSVNTQHLIEQQHNQYNKGRNDPYGALPTHPQSASQHEDGRLIMHPIKESSQEDVLRLSPSEPLGTQKFIMANTAPLSSDARSPPVPPKNFAQFQIIKSSSSQSAHERESSLDSLDKDESISDHFVSLCKKADALMDNCMLAETSDDISSALCYCDGALGCLKEAKVQKELKSKALVYVQKKYNSCLLKSRTLQKRVSASQQESYSSGIGSDVPSSVGNRSSITSSDSDMSDQVNRQPRPDSQGSTHQHRSHHGQGSTGSHNLHERQDSASRQGTDNRQGQMMDSRNGGRRDSSVTRTQRVNAGLHDSSNNRRRTDSGGGSLVPQSQSVSYLHGGNCSGGDSGGSSADLYGTLPRSKSRRATSEVAASAEVYQSFLNTQKCLQAGVSCSQQSLDSVRSDSGSEQNGTGSAHKMSKPDIRQMVQDSLAQCQWQQPAVPMSYSHQQEVRQFDSQLPHKPAYSNGQNGQLPVSGQSSWQQQPQQQHQAAHLSHPNHPHHSVSSHIHPQQQQQQWRQSTPVGRQPPPPAGPKPHIRGPAVHPHPTQTVSVQGSAPTPGLKPSLPFPPAASKTRTPSSQGSVLSSPHDVMEVGRHGLLPSVGQLTPTPHLSGLGETGNEGVYLAMMPPSSQDAAPSGAQPMGVMHRTSNALHTASSSPVYKPLQRCASQPDCQKLVDSGFSANLADKGANSCSRSRRASLRSASSDERVHTAQGSTNLQKPLSSNDVSGETEGVSVSVRALASRFENTNLGKLGSGGSRPCSRHGSMKGDNHERSSGGVGVHRTRSKSESFSRKPKSVLKNKKNKNRPRKSVTFADSLALYANCDEPNSGYESARELSSPRVALDDRAYYSDDDERLGSHASYSDNELDDAEDTGSSNSDESPLGEDDACQLCHKRRNEPGKLFCSKCSFYMGKLNSS